MRPPAWIVIANPRKGWLSADGKSVNFNIRVRMWHPGFWWAAVQAIVRGRHP